MTFKSMLLLFLLVRTTLVCSYGKPGCQESCGGVVVPYPFGIGKGCYREGWNDWFRLTCNKSTLPFLPYMYVSSSYYIQKISLSPPEIRVTSYISNSCNSGIRYPINNFLYSPYTFSYTRNIFTTVGCNALSSFTVYTTKGNFSSGCVTSCSGKEYLRNGSCSGIGCCQTSLPKDVQVFYIKIDPYNKNDNVSDFNPCFYGFLIERSQYSFRISDLTNFSFPNPDQSVPVIMDWVIGSETCEAAKKNATSYACQENSDCRESENGAGYFCTCSNGYKGNPYLQGGCIDIDECEDEAKNDCLSLCINTPGSYKCGCPDGGKGDGKKNGSRCTPRSTKKNSVALTISLGVSLGSSAFLLSLLLLFWKIYKKKQEKIRKDFFKKNGGLLIREQMLVPQRNSRMPTIFTFDELKEATDNYSDSNILGRGGHGTVYKGILPDGRVIAIKKSRIMDDDSHTKEFVNEMIILSSINHRNVVRLFGCCLESSVPMLVYEYIPNGTLFHHIHIRKSSLSWRDRLRISSETASAISYLHSSVSTPIIHRDIKSANILLDENYTAKVSDFGASRSVSFDKTHLTTLVQGTLGYLDPEYLFTGLLTDKSDVYSFGVVLVELLTGRIVSSIEASEDKKILSTCFVSSVKENRLDEILEARVAEEGKKEYIMSVAELAVECLNLNGIERPQMKDVAYILEGLFKEEINRPVHQSLKLEMQCEAHKPFNPIPTQNLNLTETQSSLIHGR